MTFTDIGTILLALGAISGLIIFFVQRRLTNQVISSGLRKSSKELEQMELEIESKYALQVKQWIDDLQEVKDTHDAEIEKKERLIQELQNARLALTAELSAAIFKAAQCGRSHRRLFTALHIPYWECDRDGKLIFANGHWLKLFGLSKDEAMGEGWLKAIPEDEKQQLLVTWYSRVVDETDGRLIFTIKNAVTGEITKAEALYAVKFDSNGEVYKIIGATIALDWVNWKGLKWGEVDKSFEL